MKKRKVRVKPYRKLTKTMAARFFFVAALLLVLLLIIMGKLIYLTIFKESSYKKQILAQQQYMNKEINYKRGDILDANGNVLATSRKLYKVILEPKNIIGIRQKKDGKEVITENQKLVTAALKKYLHATDEEINRALSNKESYYYDSLCDSKTESEISEFKKYLKTEEGSSLVGIWLDESYQRIYPKATSACHAIGFVSDGDIGVGGMEQYYNNLLKGTNGRRYTYLNEELEYDTSIDEAVNGKSLVSTLDMNIQQIAEKRLNKFMKDYGSLNTSILVMNPNNGEVLAMANSKTYNLNDPMNEENLKKYFSASKIEKMTSQEKSDAYSSIWSNYIVSNTYEPGSTFKPFTVSMGLESGVLTGDEFFTCGGSLKVNGTSIGCSHTHGTIPLSTTIAKSCNVSMMQIAAKVGSERFANYQRAFGFGSKTGIDLPGEAGAADVLHDAKMADVDLATSSFGQSFQCTMIQLGSAFCSLINGGNYYQPHIVKQVLDSNGDVEKNITKTLVKKNISEETSEKMRSYMRETVESGTARIAQIKEYDLAGKTGTAEKYPRGTNKRLVSFIGFAPYDNPQLMVYVTIDEIQKGSQSNTSLAVQMARDILQKSLKHLNVEQNSEDKEKETN
ncbi:MAG: penicillin-binding protein 2 [Lachnospiraceae bacterium]|nr:penicillin-binding protein 2 [Lachnospiraceae bacterium]